MHFSGLVHKQLPGCTFSSGAWSGDLYQFEGPLVAQN